MSSQAFFQPSIFSDYSSVVAAHSLRNTALPAANSMLPAGATDEEAASNRRRLAESLGYTDIITPKLTHGDTVYELQDGYSFDTRPEADAIITDKPGRLIGIGVADCIVILLYDPKHQAIAAIHSGWRGTAANIADKAVQAMKDRYDSEAAKLLAYTSPSPQRFEYGVPNDTAGLFGNCYTSPKTDDDAWFDNKLAVYDQLIGCGVQPQHIEVDARTNFTPDFHSFRRDREHSGRHMVVIGLR